jgi:membrane-associated phospholipid phosphatase
MFLKTRKVVKYSLLFLFVFFFSTYSVYADNKENTETGNDSIPATSHKFPYKQLIAPAALMAYGAIEVTLAPKNRLLNYAIGHEVINHQPEKFQIDDITQYVPAASVYALNLFGIKGKNNFKDRTIILGMSSLFVAASVNGIKYTAKVERPDKSARNSFPSGHTAIAFMGAEFLWQEYKDISIWYGIVGYTIAAGTGAFRMYNNKHWFGDVAFGAGIGILSTKLAYWIYPSIKRKFSRSHKNGKNMAFYPFYNGQQGGFSFSIQL